MPAELPIVRLEPLEPAHAPRLLEGLQDPAIHRFIGDAPPPDVETLARRYARLATRRSPDGRPLWLNWAVRAEAGIAYVLFPPHWGHGHARAAVGEMLRRLAEAHGVERFGARVDLRNGASRALLASLGFREHAVHRHAAVIRGEPAHQRQG